MSLNLTLKSEYPINLIMLTIYFAMNHAQYEVGI